MSDLGNQPEEEKLSEVQELSVEEVVGTIKRCQGSNIKFTFLLGSGASVSSGIPTGGELAQKWYKELEQDLPKNRFEAWQKLKECKGVEDENRRAEFYSPIYEKRFGHIPEEGYNELKKIMEGKDPSLGYFILAQIISKTRNNIVLTTNFDNLLEDAVRSYTEKTPFVAGHELLADHITSHTDRPIIIKLHRDLLLHPCNTMEETGKLPEQWKKNLRNILSSSTLIVLGYGGNDGSLMNFLEGLPLAQRKGIYWCVRNLEDLAPRIREVLKKDSDRVVLIKDFDDFMYRCAVQLEYKNQFQDIVHISKIRDYPKVIEPLLRRLRKIYYKLGSLLRSLRDKEKIPDYLQQLLLEIYKETYTILVNAGKEEKSDPKKADEIYRCGIDQDSDNPFLLGAYADFLSNICQDYDRAEQYYKRAIEADPNHVNTLGNYAVFLKNIRKDYDKAEVFYLRAFDLAPQDADFLGNYALFLKNIRKDYDKAEEYYKRALDADPQHANNLGSYANLLCDIRKDYDKAEVFYLRAFDVAPQDADFLGNYALFLNDVRKDYVKAEAYYLRALDADPQHANNLGNYALFLKNIRKDYDKAEAYYLKALDAEPQHANNLGNYASFLKDIRKDYDKAEAYYLRALDADPQHANNLGNYAIFLKDIRKDYDKAEAYYQRALEAKPQNANILGNYAVFLKNIRKDYDTAEEYYKRALEADPQDATNLSNYANFLTVVRQEYDEAEKYYLQSISIEPNNRSILRNYAIFLQGVRKDKEKANEYFKRAEVEQSEGA